MLALFPLLILPSCPPRSVAFLWVFPKQLLEGEFATIAFGWCEITLKAELERLALHRWFSKMAAETCR
ncbi:MAG TPA: hypothetical protein DDZ80_26870 [Cyanobacteria bacterium UBA8803]|nr:hypothetical protein [Cyanobacteria bacterium UBA9273]HBL61901.1 hypothetical protein [Cyanobacteria bacterium UBA8803]